MLEESLASVNSWFTPTLLFLLLNIVIGTIAIASNFGTSYKQPQETEAHQEQEQEQEQEQQQHFLARAPSSTLERLKSINLYRFRSQDFNPFSTTTTTTIQQPPLLIPSSETEIEIQAEETTHEDPGVHKNPYDDIVEHHMTRTKSDTKPASGHMPVSLPQKMKKSASTKSAFGHFEFEEAETNKLVERRRPSTARDSNKKVRSNLQTFGEDQEVDAKADDFINRFKHQLKLQRLDSLIRYKETLSRGANK